MLFIAKVKRIATYRSARVSREMRMERVRPLCSCTSITPDHKARDVDAFGAPLDPDSEHVVQPPLYPFPQLRQIQPCEARDSGAQMRIRLIRPAKRFTDMAEQFVACGDVHPQRQCPPAAPAATWAPAPQT